MATTLKKKATEVVGLDQSILEMDSGLGNKEIDQDTLSIPFLKTNLTDEILSGNRGAVKGDMYNTVTGEIFDREKGMYFDVREVDGELYYLKCPIPKPGEKEN